jgi:hypothetical protein
MKKPGFLLVFLVLSSTVFAFEIICTASIRVYPAVPAAYEYEFLSMDGSKTEEIMYLGYYISMFHQFHPISENGYIITDRVIENNTALSQALKDKMRQVGANVCISADFKDYIVVNLLMPNGTYTTIFYVPLKIE